MGTNHPTWSSPSRILSRNNKSSRDRSPLLRSLPPFSFLTRIMCFGSQIRCKGNFQGFFFCFFAVGQLQRHLKRNQGSKARSAVCMWILVFHKWLANEDYINLCLDLSDAKRLPVLSVPDGSGQAYSWHSCAQLMSSPSEPEPSGRQED